jgi:hypothetical protein
MKVTDTGPPKNGTGRLACKQNRTRENDKLGRKYRHRRRNASVAYFRMLAEREAQGLLFWFSCSRCGSYSLDPIGWDGPGRPLCETCADGAI